MSPNTPMNNDNTPTNPMTEAHITDAFRDLSRRAGTVAVDNGPHVQAAAGGRRVRRAANPLGGFGGGDNRLIPALAFAVLAVIAGFGAWRLLPGGDGSDNVNVATDGVTDDGTIDNDGDSDGAVVTDDGTTDDTDTTADGENGNNIPAVGEAGARFRVDTAKVAADTSDPFLNVRRAPDAGAELLAKLPPTYRGVVLTGESATADDGATWFQVRLIDPVRVNLGEPLHGGQPVGWVNAAFLIPLEDGLAVGTDEVPACAFLPEESGTFGGLAGSGYVYALESRTFGDDCLRVVVTLSAGSNPFLWEEVPAGTGPAGALPDAFVSSSGGNGVTLELGDNIASAWPSATETDDGVYIARSTDGTVDLVTPVPVGRVGVTPLADSGILVIDMEVAGDAPQTGRFVALTDQPAVGAGTVTVTGLARPFEANLGVSIVDDDGQPVAALYSGSAALGTLRSTEYGVQTTDWTEAWGRFAVTAADLQPGSYTMLLDGEGGVETPTRTAVPFTITEPPTSSTGEPDADDQAAAQALVRFAQGGPVTDLGLAAEVTLGLGLDHQETFTRAQLANRDNWVIDVDEFDGFVGPFDILERLADGRVTFSSGPIPHCAGPPLDWPTEWDALSQVNIEPVGVDSCIAWYGVSLFRNNNGEVEVVVLDLYGP
ncbi:MAG: Gmad2 immunoglobulin-like domain-containing protein [Acidimicrobiia bacterium]|nr:Gmad2 immunoglobulin-like domain-containing protein [Acidimicrobiia bacterium]